MRLITASTEILNKDKINGVEILKTIEEVGRTCYKSVDKITDNSYSKFVQSLVKNGHLAMIEFADITVRFTVDRGITHELVRHRHCNFAQESTRYCNYSQGKFDNEVNFIDIGPGIELCPTTSRMPPVVKAAIVDEWITACCDAESHYLRMLELGATPQIARSVLNNSVKADLNVNANLREWRHIFKLRCDKAAHPQMREVMVPLLKEFAELIPVVFDDLVEKYC